VSFFLKYFFSGAYKMHALLNSNKMKIFAGTLELDSGSQPPIKTNSTALVNNLFCERALHCDSTGNIMSNKFEIQGVPIEGYVLTGRNSKIAHWESPKVLGTDLQITGQTVNGHVLTAIGSGFAEWRSPGDITGNVHCKEIVGNSLSCLDAKIVDLECGTLELGELIIHNNDVVKNLRAQHAVLAEDSMRLAGIRISGVPKPGQALIMGLNDASWQDINGKLNVDSVHAKDLITNTLNVNDTGVVRNLNAEFAQNAINSSKLNQLSLHGNPLQGDIIAFDGIGMSWAQLDRTNFENITADTITCNKLNVPNLHSMTCSLANNTLALVGLHVEPVKDNSELRFLSNNGTWVQPSVNVIKRLTIDLTSELIHSLYDKPIQLLPSPGINNAIIVNRIRCSYKAKTAYMNGGSIILRTGTYSMLVIEATPLKLQKDAEFVTTEYSHRGIALDAPLTLHALAQFISGNGSLSITIDYEIV
jgi:hypothetical protein